MTHEEREPEASSSWYTLQFGYRLIDNPTDGNLSHLRIERYLAEKPRIGSTITIETGSHSPLILYVTRITSGAPHPTLLLKDVHTIRLRPQEVEHLESEGWHVCRA